LMVTMSANRISIEIEGEKKKKWKIRRQ
jgi:hypothetical protein